MFILILVRSYLSPIISTASSSGCVSLSFFVDPILLPPPYKYTPCFHFLCVCFVSWWLLSLRLSLSIPLSLSLSLLYSLSNSCFSFAFRPFLYTSSVEFDSPDIPLLLSHSFLYAAFSPPPRHSMCSSSTCSAPGRCQTSVNGFQLCPPLAVQLLSFPLVSASMAAATHSKP